MDIDRLQSRDLTKLLIPEEQSFEILGKAKDTSVVLQNAVIKRMDTKTSRMPYISSRPEAAFVEPVDTGLKKTTNIGFSPVILDVQEIATILAVPDAVIDDSKVHIPDEFIPEIAAAFARTTDKSILFGEGIPAVWGKGIIPTAIEAGNVVTEGTNTDLYGDVIALGEKLAEKNYLPNGYIANQKYRYKLYNQRNALGQPLMTPAGDTARKADLFGSPLDLVNPEIWDEAKAKLVAIDWNNHVIGLRQDLTMSVSNSAAYLNDNGEMTSAFQTDTTLFRFVMRFAYAAVPLNGGYPAAVLVPGGNNPGGKK